jgi:hypothetical protein
MAVLRACGVRLDPAETEAHEGCCPVCGNRVTLGVAHRVEMLADRKEAPAGSHSVRPPVERPTVRLKFVILIFAHVRARSVGFGMRQTVAMHTARTSGRDERGMAAWPKSATDRIHRRSSPSRRFQTLRLGITRF